MALLDLPTPKDDRPDNLRRAVSSFELALPDALNAIEAAELHYQLAKAWIRLAEYDGPTVLEEALNQCRMAQDWFRRDRQPRAWAKTESLRGRALELLPEADGENLRQAIHAHQEALKILTSRDYPRDWARTQRDLARALAKLPIGDRVENLQRAIAADLAALGVLTAATFPSEARQIEVHLDECRRMLDPLARGFRQA